LCHWIKHWNIWRFRNRTGESLCSNFYMTYHTTVLMIDHTKSVALSLISYYFTFNTLKCQTWRHKPVSIFLVPLLPGQLDGAAVRVQGRPPGDLYWAAGAWCWHWTQGPGNLLSLSAFRINVSTDGFIWRPLLQQMLEGALLAHLSTKCYCGQWLSVVRRVSCVNIWCLHSRDHICDMIFMKLGQNVCFDNI